MLHIVVATIGAIFWHTPHINAFWGKIAYVQSYKNTKIVSVANKQNLTIITCSLGCRHFIGQKIARYLLQTAVFPLVFFNYLLLRRPFASPQLFLSESSLIKITWAIQMSLMLFFYDLLTSTLQLFLNQSQAAWRTICSRGTIYPLIAIEEQLSNFVPLIFRSRG